MKPTATLVNIARGGIVDDAALAQALRERRIAAAGLMCSKASPRCIRVAGRCQCGAHAAHRQRHRRHPAGHGQPGGRQPDCLLRRAWATGLREHTLAVRIMAKILRRTDGSGAYAATQLSN